MRLSDRGLIVLCITGLAVVAVLLTDSGQPEARAEHAGAVNIGTVTQAHNGVRRRAAKQLAWETLQPGDGAFDHDTVFVPPSASAVIYLGDGSRLSLEPNTLVVLQTPMSVFVERGGVVGQSAHPLTVQTPKGEVTVEGQARLTDKGDTTVFAGTAIAGGTTLAANEGVVAGEKRTYSARLIAPTAGQRIFTAKTRFQWSGAGTARVMSDKVVHESRKTDFELTLPPGEYTWEVVGASPLAPFAVIADVPPRGLAPRHLERISKVRYDAVPFAWTRVVGAERYFVDIASDADFKQLQRTVPCGSTRVWVPADFPEGVIHWRVRAEGRDRPNTVSAVNTFRFSLTSAPDAPEVYDPEVDLGHR